MSRENRRDVGVHKPNATLTDKGFSSEFEWKDVQGLCRVFSEDEEVLAYIYGLRASDNSIDIKRGELYPELLRAAYSLQEICGRVFGIDCAQVQPNFGSNGSIDTILTATKIQETENIATGKTSEMENLGKGVMFATPTYFRNYNSAGARNLTIHKVPLLGDFEFDAKTFVRQMIRIRPTIVILVTPNNPSGLPIRDEDILLVFDNLPKETWAMLDRTCANTRPEISSHELLHRYAGKNLVILHSFSKYKGMSHQRIGLAFYTNRAMAAKVQPLLPLGLGLEGLIKAYKIIKEEGGLSPSKGVLKNIESNYAVLKEFVKNNQGYYLPNFSSNYCLMKLPDYLSSEVVSEALAQHGLYVMGGHEFPEPDHRLVRLHVGGKPKYIEKMCRVLTTMPKI